MVLKRMHREAHRRAKRRAAATGPMQCMLRLSDSLLSKQSSPSSCQAACTCMRRSVMDMRLRFTGGTQCCATSAPFPLSTRQEPAGSIAVQLPHCVRTGLGLAALWHGCFELCFTVAASDATRTQVRQCQLHKSIQPNLQRHSGCTSRLRPCFTQNHVMHQPIVKHAGRRAGWQ